MVLVGAQPLRDPFGRLVGGWGEKTDFVFGI